MPKKSDFLTLFINLFIAFFLLLFYIEYHNFPGLSKCSSLSLLFLGVIETYNKIYGCHILFFCHDKLKRGGQFPPPPAVLAITLNELKVLPVIVTDITPQPL